MTLDSAEQHGPSRANAGQEEEIPLIVLVNVLLENARLVVGVPLVLFALVVVISLMMPRQYEAESEFMPEQTDPRAGGAAGLALQLGLDLGGAGVQSLEFYTQLLETRELLTEVARTPFRVEGPGGDTVSLPLVAVLDVDREAPDGGLRETVDILRESITTETDRSSGIITMTTEAPTPGLAVQLNRRLLELLNDFNIEKRQTRAKLEREFVQRRMGESEDQLRSAESELQQFLEQNRQYQSSPQLLFEATRLERNVQLRQQLYTSTAQSYENARVAEIRENPVLTVVDAPEGSAEPAGRGILTRGLAALVLGGLVGVGLAFGRAYSRRQRRRNPEEYSRFDHLRQGAVSRLVSRPPRGDGQEEAEREPVAPGGGA